MLTVKKETILIIISSNLSGDRGRTAVSFTRVSLQQE